MNRSVTHTEDTCSGSPRIDGTRLTCANVVLPLGIDGMEVEQFLESYPYLDRGDIERCVQYCSQQRCVDDRVLTYCQGCSLDTRVSEHPEFSEASDHAICEDHSVNVWEIALQLLSRWGV